MMAEKLGVSEAELRRPAPITVMTRGEAGALITVGREEFEIPPAKPGVVADPTGAGDALRRLYPGIEDGISLAGRRTAGRPDGRPRDRTSGSTTTLVHARGFQARYRENFGSSREVDSLAGMRLAANVIPRAFRLAETTGARNPDSGIVRGL